jgi:hypothetical protein
MLLHGLLAGGSLISYIHNQKVDTYDTPSYSR